MTSTAQKKVGLQMIPTGQTMSLSPLSIQIITDDGELRLRLRELAAAQSAGPFQFQFCRRADGMQPLLEPGLDAVLIDLKAGDADDLAYLARVIALGPDVPVLALADDTPDLQWEIMSAGAEDCLSRAESPRATGLALRRAVTRRQLRDTREPQADAAPQAQAVTLVQEASDAIVILDNSGLVRFANEAALDLFGCKESEIIGKPFALPSDIGEHEVSVNRPDGDNRMAEMRIIETRWGGMPARVAALNDISVRQKLEQTMQAAEARSRTSEKRNLSFFSNVNHDLRTPLTHIIGFSELMKNEQFGPMGQARYRDYASDIHSSGTMLLDMIEDLLGIAEAETDEVSLSDEICNIGQLVEIAVASQRGHAAEDNVTLEIDCPDRLPGLRGDARRLRQGLFRLITEAIHCAPHGAVLKLAVSEAAGEISVTLTEHLAGGATHGDQTRLPHMTDDPFVSSENSGIARADSLALSLTRKVMELHGGSLDILQSADAPTAIALHFPVGRTIR